MSEKYNKEDIDYLYEVGKRKREIIDVAIKALQKIIDEFKNARNYYSTSYQQKEVAEEALFEIRKLKKKLI